MPPATEPRDHGGPVILAAVDFSPQSRDALQAAGRLAGDMGCRLVLVHVFEPVPYPQAVGTDALDAIQETQGELAVDEAIELTTDWAERVRRHGVAVETRFLEGTPDQEILAEAAKHDTTMIVVGTHGRSGITDWIGGSVAKRLLKKSKRPVLLVPKVDDGD